MSNPENPPPQPITPRPIASLQRLRLAMDHDLRIRLGLVITIGGFVVFIIGCHPAIIGMDRSLLIGVVQIVVHDRKVTQIERTEKTRIGPAPIEPRLRYESR